MNNSNPSTTTAKDLLQKIKNRGLRIAENPLLEVQNSIIEIDMSLKIEPPQKIMEISTKKPRECEEKSPDTLRMDAMAQQKLLEGSISYYFSHFVGQEVDTLQATQVRDTSLEEESHDRSEDVLSSTQQQKVGFKGVLRKAKVNIDISGDNNVIQNQSKSRVVIEKSSLKPVIIQRRRNYSIGKDKEEMEKAVSECKLQESKPADERTSVRKIAGKYDVDYRSLNERVKGKIEVNSHQGKASILTQKQEDELVKHIELISSLGYGYDALECREAARKFPVLKPFVASRGWWEKFKARHPELSRRKAQGISLSRIQGTSPEHIQEWLATLKSGIELVEELSEGRELLSKNIFNMDEFHVSCSKSLGWVIAFKGKQQVLKVQEDKLPHLSGVATISANGDAIPLFFIAKGKKDREKLLSQCTLNSDYAMSAKGWMTEEVYKKYVGFFVKNLPPRHPEEWILFIVDGLGAHVYGVEALQLLYDNKILCISLPSHSTSILQPLDVCLFGTLKKYFRRHLGEKQRIQGLKTTLEDIVEVVELAWLQSFKRATIIKAFETTGIHPYDKDWVAKNLDKLRVSEGVMKFPPATLKEKEKYFNSLAAKIDLETHLKDISYLDLDYDQFLVARKTSSLPALPLHVIKTKKRKRSNFMQEDPSKGKVLNTTERLKKLNESKPKMKKKAISRTSGGKKTKKTKKTKDSKKDDDSFEERIQMPSSFHMVLRSRKPSQNKKV